MADKKFPPKISAFLAAIQLTPDITLAAKAAGVNRSAHYQAMKRDPDYRAAFEEAYLIGVEALEDAVVRRVQRGVKRLKFYHGSPVTMHTDPNDPESPLVYVYERDYSDGLASLVLKAKKPLEYKDRVEHDVTPATKKFQGTMEECLALYRQAIQEEQELS